MPERTADLWWLFSRQTVSVTQKESVLNAAILMQKRNFRHLPVITDEGRIAGLVSAQDIMDSIALVLDPQISASKVVDSLDIPVHRIMALHPIVIEKGDGLSEVVKKLCSNNIGALPVVDEMGKVQGIITLRDIVSLIGTGSEPIGVRVSEIMTKNVFTIDPEATILDAAIMMSERRVRRLPILSKGGELSGMLSNKDILRQLAKHFFQRKEDSRFNAKISELMTREVITVEEEDDVRTAASRMMIFGIGGLGIQTASSPIAGLVTERDIVRRLVERRSVSFLIQSMKFELEAEKYLH
ncbi:MAG: CBS domain-containing protein [Thaumarchaeota archaeon]|nr:CBS domain-containing protein [Nitrososphaerota archaeon]MDG6905326.1 CBS domain-containing protein [Nitrososphaerota archaeon]